MPHSAPASHFISTATQSALCITWHAKLMLLSSRGILCMSWYVQLPHFFPPCSIALAAAAGLSCPRIPLCTFYPQSIQEYCVFGFTVNAVPAMAIETPETCICVLRVCHLVHLSQKTFMRQNWQTKTSLFSTGVLHTKPAESH